MTWNAPADSEVGRRQFVKVKIQKMGGLLKTYQAVQVAEAFGVPVIWTWVWSDLNTWPITLAAATGYREWMRVGGAHQNAVM